MGEKITLTLKSKEIKYLSGQDKRLSLVFNLVGDISYTLHNDPYSFLVETIIGQMLSNKVADILTERVKEACCGSINPESINKLSTSKLRDLGLSNSKSNYIYNLTEAVTNNSINLSTLEFMSDKEVIKSLTSVKGIGNWSAKMYLIFVLGREDVLPYEDGAFIQSYSWLYNTKDTKPLDIQNSCKNWSPYASIASRYLYRVLDLGFTKKTL